MKFVSEQVMLKVTTILVSRAGGCGYKKYGIITQYWSRLLFVCKLENCGYQNMRISHKDTEAPWGIMPLDTMQENVYWWLNTLPQISLATFDVGIVDSENAVKYLGESKMNVSLAQLTFLMLTLQTIYTYIYIYIHIYINIYCQGQNTG